MATKPSNALFLNHTIGFSSITYRFYPPMPPFPISLFLVENMKSCRSHASLNYRV
jgi:hypothetical protein